MTPSPPSRSEQFWKPVACGDLVLRFLADLQDDFSAVVDSSDEDVDRHALGRLRSTITNLTTVLTISLGRHPASVIVAREQRDAVHPRYPGKWWTSEAALAVRPVGERHKPLPPY